MTAYTDSYIESVFQIWYSLGCPSYPELQKQIPPDEHGRIPVPEVVRKWAAEGQWHVRKDELDARAIVKAEENLVTQQVEMWKRHADAAARVRQEALSYIEEHGFDSSASAVQALKWAQEEERKTRGAEGFIAAIKDKSNDDLIKMVRELATRQVAIEDGGIIESETNEESSA